MKTIIKSTLFLAILLSIVACGKDNGMDIIDNDTDNNNDNSDLPFDVGFGAFGDEDASEVPSDIFFGNGDIPSAYDISQFLPPVKNQGNYGTCVAWALGYNLKTAIEAMDKGYSKNDLQDERFQFSPKDLFLSIDNIDKGDNCNGTRLYNAFDKMQSRGIATENTVPYTNLGDCSQSTSSNGNNEAGNFTIDNYRSIDINANTMKQYLANDRPIGFGAKLGDNFKWWDSDDVITGHTSFDEVGIHSYHAMTAVGYDDNKGVNGAFKVVNSWGQSWGDEGYIWADYNFFTAGDFCFVAYVAKNGGSDVNPNDDTNDDDPVDPNTNGNVDLIPWGLMDDGGNEFNPRDRQLSYNVYNIGNGTARASDDWGVAYLYYNAYDANDYGILLFDYYTDDYGSAGQNGDMGQGPGMSGNWWNNVDIASGSNIAQAVAGTDENFNWGYELPKINGYYYLVMIADVYDVIKEVDESNNYFYMTDSYGNPIWFEDGIPFSMETPSEVKAGQVSDVTENHLAPAEKNSELSNAYTKEEIQNMIETMKSNGQLDEVIKKSRKKQ